MKKKDERTKDWILKLAAVFGGSITAAFLFMASPLSANAVPLGSQPSGTSGTVNEETDGGEENAEEAGEEAGTTDEAATATTAVTSATVTSSSVNVRSDASTSSDVAGTATNGMEVTVTGEKTDSEGNLWYAVSFESDGGTVTGYIRSDLVEAHETEVAPETPVEETAPVEEETTPEAAPSDDYYVQYEDDGSGTGTSAWYLHDNSMGTRYKVEELLSAVETNQQNQATMEQQTGNLRLIIIVMAAVIVVLIIVVTIFILKLRSAYEDGYEDDEEDDEEEDEDEDEEEERRPVRRRFGRTASRRSERDEEEDDEEDDEDEEEDDEDDDYPSGRRPSRKTTVKKQTRRTRYADDEDEDDEDDEDEDDRRGRRSKSSKSDKNWQSRNFLDDDDLEFEFLDLK